jgi:hypothetical protein
VDAKTLLTSVSQVKVFASFDCEKDEKLLQRLLVEARSPDAKFVVMDRSMKEPPSPDRAERLCQRLSRVDAVFVLCGPWTHKAPNVEEEVKMAQELGIRYYLLKGHPFRECARPSSARLADKMFKWLKATPDELALRNI